MRSRTVLALAVVLTIFVLPLLALRQEVLVPGGIVVAALLVVVLAWWRFERWQVGNPSIVGTGRRYLEYAYNSQSDAVREADRVNEEADRAEEAIEQAREQ